LCGRDVAPLGHRIGNDDLQLRGSIGLVIRPFDKSFYPKVCTFVKTFFFRVGFFNYGLFFCKRHLDGTRGIRSFCLSGGVGRECGGMARVVPLENVESFPSGLLVSFPFLAFFKTFFVVFLVRSFRRIFPERDYGRTGKSFTIGSIGYSRGISTGTLPSLIGGTMGGCPVFFKICRPSAESISLMK
jgi:hypothetical protein